jgi:hypothetical protein
MKDLQNIVSVHIQPIVLSKYVYYGQYLSLQTESPTLTHREAQRADDHLHGANNVENLHGSRGFLQPVKRLVSQRVAKDILKNQQAGICLDRDLA